MMFGGFVGMGDKVKVAGEQGDEQVFAQQLDVDGLAVGGGVRARTWPLGKARDEPALAVAFVDTRGVRPLG